MPVLYTNYGCRALDTVILLPQDREAAGGRRMGLSKERNCRQDDFFFQPAAMGISFTGEEKHCCPVKSFFPLSQQKNHQQESGKEPEGHNRSNPDKDGEKKFRDRPAKIFSRVFFKGCHIIHRTIFISHYNSEHYNR